MMTIVEDAYRIDLLVENEIVIELKTLINYYRCIIGKYEHILNYPIIVWAILSISILILLKMELTE